MLAAQSHLERNMLKSSQAQQDFKMEQIQSEAKLTFGEATSIIIGHGIGSGILAVPFVASRNSLVSVVGVLILAYVLNLLLHLFIAELSLNNGGAQFIKCFERELFVGKIKKPATWIAFALLGFSVLINVSGFVVGAADVLESWLGLPHLAGVIIYYLASSIVVFVGMKLVGICEKYSVLAMICVIVLLFCGTVLDKPFTPHNVFVKYSNTIVLFSIVMFSLSAVMSVPQVVKGLDGDCKKIRSAISLGTLVNVSVIGLITLTTLVGAGSHITSRGALIDLSEANGGWVAIIGYVFSLLALSTSFWANTLNLRDIVFEQLNLDKKICFLVASLPSVVIAALNIGSFVGFVRLAGVIQVLTGLGVIIAYGRSRKKAGTSPIVGVAGSIPFEIIVALSSVLATAGSLIAIA